MSRHCDRLAKYNDVEGALKEPNAPNSDSTALAPSVRIEFEEPFVPYTVGLRKVTRDGKLVGDDEYEVHVLVCFMGSCYISVIWTLEHANKI